MRRALLIIAVLLPVASAGAQKQPVAIDSCLYGITDKAFRRVPVFLEATADSASRMDLPAADLFAQSVAFKLRELAGGSESRLAQADSAVWWASLWGEIRVTAHRDGHPTWSIPEWSLGADTLVRSGLRRLARAVEAVAQSGESIPLRENGPDSVSFGLSLVHPLVMRDGRIIPVKARQPVAVFTLLVPWEEPAQLLKLPNIEYSEFSRRLGATGAVRLAFLVDKSGRADVETVKEVVLPGEKKPVGEDRIYADGFIRSVKRALPSAKFAPATIGGCPLNQVVQQLFDFRWSARQ